MNHCAFVAGLRAAFADLLFGDTPPLDRPGRLALVGSMKAERAGQLFVIISLALLMWVLPVAHALPIDADGPSGLSDNADFDDLIVSLTSPTAAIAPVLVVIIPASLNATENVTPSEPTTVHRLVRSSVEGRAPPLV
jgi:hypothetical protein